MQIPVKDRSQTIYGSQIDYTYETEIVLHTIDHDDVVEMEKEYDFERFDDGGDGYATYTYTTYFCPICDRELNQEEIDRL